MQFAGRLYYRRVDMDAMATVLADEARWLPEDALTGSQTEVKPAAAVSI
jgi:hypothetical protein